MPAPFLVRAATAVLLAQMASGPARADDGGIWIAGSATVPISGPVVGLVDTNVRLAESGGRFSQFLVRAGLGYRLQSGLQVGGGYAYVHTQSSAGARRDEHRIFQQASFPIHRRGRTALTGRTRLEQRFVSGGDDVGLRFRQQLRLSVPLQQAGELRAVASVEALVPLNDTDWGARTGFDQLRSFAGLEIPLFGKTRLEAGYLNQAIFTGADTTNHVLSLNLATTF